jgi:hypothetical protein
VKVEDSRVLFFMPSPDAVATTTFILKNKK